MDYANSPLPELPNRTDRPNPLVQGREVLPVVPAQKEQAAAGLDTGADERQPGSRGRRAARNAQGGSVGGEKGAWLLVNQAILRMKANKEAA